MDKQDIKDMISKLEQEDSLFSKKSLLDSLLAPTKIMGRKEETKNLLRFLASHKQGYVVPYISVYGRSGAGKSSVVRFMCENMDAISYRLVNLRQAKTVFGAANLILAELGQQNLQSAKGINLAVDEIGKAIKSVLHDEAKQLFVLVLDELDTIFYDKRGKPSDFVYKLIVLEEKLRAKGLLLCIIGISNNVLSEYELDDRVKSRIGSSEVFFKPYSKAEVLSILKDRASQAFSKKIDDKVLEYCAELSSAENGDARRAMDLLRVAGELAGSKNEELEVQHVDRASSELQKDRISQTLYSASYHLRLACGGLVRITFLTGDDWHSTSLIYTQYTKLLQKGTKPLSYRRVSDLLTELENSGLVVSQTSSKGRHGYGTQYKLVVPPEMIGPVISKEWWEDTVKRKKEHESEPAGLKFDYFGSTRKSGDPLEKMLNKMSQDKWDDFVGLN